MARRTKAEAARQLGIARSALYKLIDQGKLSPASDGFIDQAALVRVAADADVRRHAHSPRISPSRRHGQTSADT